MTGSEAWSIVAPLIAHHMHDYREITGKHSLDAIDTAYVLCCAALKEWDKKGEKDDTDY